MTRTKDRIVSQADVLFYERGFEATSLADIAGGWACLAGISTIISRLRMRF